MKNLRKITLLTCIILLSVFAIPAIISGSSDLYNRLKNNTESENVDINGNYVNDKDINQTEPDNINEKNNKNKSVSITPGSMEKPFKISVYMTSKNQVCEYDFEEYTAGFVAGEMPPTYNTEAFCAQAVAARSFILSKAEVYFKGAPPEEHHGAMVCDNPYHCKGWNDLDAAATKWDPRYAEDYKNKILGAVKRTEGEYMDYDGEVVKAYFYAVSSGKTENAEDVWGCKLPYLKSVESREDIMSDGYESLSTFTVKSFFERLSRGKSDFLNSNLNDGKNEIFSDIRRSEGGGVTNIKIGDTEFSGEEVKNILELKSTCFEIEINGKKYDGQKKLNETDKISFRVYGNGHRVGMSQNGANVLAGRGMSYNDILKHYYTGVNIVNLYKKQ